jgi:hypothetical protein
MIESPVLRDFVAEFRQADVLRFLRRRFGEVPADLSAAVQQVSEPARLDRLIDAAADSPDLDAFRAQLGP